MSAIHLQKPRKVNKKWEKKDQQNKIAYIITTQVSIANAQYQLIHHTLIIKLI